MQTTTRSEPPIRVIVLASDPLIRYALSTIVRDHSRFTLARVVAAPERLPRRITADVVLAHIVDDADFDTAFPIVRVGLQHSPEWIVAALHRTTGGEPAVPRQPSKPLTARELEVVALVASGYTDHQIADALFLSVRTIRSHLDRIREKTGQRRRADLTRWYVRDGQPTER